MFFTQQTESIGDMWEMAGYMYQADQFHLTSCAQNYLLPSALEYMIQPSGPELSQWEAECQQASASEVGAAECEAASDCSTIDSCLQGRSQRAEHAQGKQQ